MESVSSIVNALELDGATNIKLIRCDVYKDAETDMWLMSAEYEFDANGLKKRLEIPAMTLPIPTNRFPIFNQSIEPPYRCISHNTSYIDTCDMYLRFGVVHKTDGTPLIGSDGRGEEALVATKIVPKDMTKSEIEDKLGYPINIIKED